MKIFSWQKFLHVWYLQSIHALATLPTASFQYPLGPGVASNCSTFITPLSNYLCKQLSTVTWHTIDHSSGAIAELD